MNEKLTEEVTKIADTTQNFTNEASKLVLDRFRNPYILTFLISWILFNWKPISFFIFSEGNVEYKIKTIVIHYSDSLNYFFFPFGITILYLFALPYLNQANEYFLQKSFKHRANFDKKKILLKINNDKEIAIADNEKQDEIKKAKEGADHNKFVEELQLTIATLQVNLNDERSKINDLIVEYEEKLRIEREDRQKVIVDYETVQKEYKNQLKNAKDDIDMYKNDFKYTNNKYNSVKQDLEIEKFVLSRYKDPKSKVLSTENSYILEYFNDLNEVRFFDLQRRQMISKDEAFELLFDKEIEINTSEYEVKRSIGIMNSVIN